MNLINRIKLLVEEVIFKEVNIKEALYTSNLIYMVPADIITINTFAYNANHKIDKIF